MTTALNLHATTVVVRDGGVMIRGASGAGKTRLAMALVEEARRDGAFGRLVADDRTLVSRHGDRLVARPHPVLAGLVECRGLDILTVDHEPACVLRLVVDLVDGHPPRLPDGRFPECDIDGLAVPCLAVAIQAATGDAVALISAKLKLLTTSS